MERLVYSSSSCYHPHPNCHPHPPLCQLQILMLYCHHVPPRLDEGQHAC